MLASTFIFDMFYILLSVAYNMWTMVLENPLRFMIFGLHQVPNTTLQEPKGPEVKLGAPMRKNNSLIDTEALKLQQPNMHLHGTLRFPSGKAVPRAKMHIWHPDHTGCYSFWGYDCRGWIQVQNDTGKYAFDTVLPGAINLNTVCNGMLGKWATQYVKRPPHFHIEIVYQNAKGTTKTFVTQVYTGETNFEQDAISKALHLPKSRALLIEPKEVDGSTNAPAVKHYAAEFDFILPE